MSIERKPPMSTMKPSGASLLSRVAIAAGALLLSAAAFAADPQVSIKTTMGEIVLELDQEKAPLTVANFLQYVKSGFYKGTIFHRVIDGFMIQGGGFEVGMKQKDTDQNVENEGKNGLKNDKYTIAMARTSAPHSASAQFFINTKNNAFLDYPGQDGWGYAVFGKVTEGLEVVDALNGVKTTRSGMHSDVPVDAIIIEKIEVL